MNHRVPFAVIVSLSLSHNALEAKSPARTLEAKSPARALEAKSTVRTAPASADLIGAQRVTFNETAVLSYVDPFIGTGGIGYGVGSIVPGPTRPFGMVKLSPDTTTGNFAPGFSHCGGYYYVDPEIRGFTHNHLVGTGVADQGNLLVMPLDGISGRQTLEAGYRSSFSHDREAAAAGYYAVTLDNGDILAELTATDRVGIHRYTFPAGTQPTVLIDPSAVLGEGTASNVWIEVLPDGQEIVGGMTNHGSLSGRYGGQPIYFSALFKTPFDRFGVFSDGQLFPDQSTMSGDERLGAYVQLEASGDTRVELAMGISYISVDQARLNRELEASDWNFDAVRADAEAVWADALSVIDVEGGTDLERRVFYSALYHTQMMPTLYTDVNGLYPGFDRQTHQAEGFTYYTDLSLWDTFRTLHPLLNLIAPDRQGDLITSMLHMHAQAGFIDRWPQGNGPTGCMVGDSPAIVIAESYLKGVVNFDAAYAYQALRDYGTLESAGAHREQLTEYLQLGYVPIETGGSSASKTLEYAYDDGAMAYFAEALGKDADVEMWRDRALSYRNQWDPSVGFLQGRHADGTFAEPFHPYSFADHYAEGNAWQWTWYAPQDVAGLIELFGGDSAFEGRLDQNFARSERTRDTLLPDMNYWHGNEPDLHAPYLYHFAGQPGKSQKWARWVMQTKYDDTPAGLDGNDDGGTLSAWYVLSALGLFPIAGTDLYLIGSPIFSRATVHLKGGELVVVASNASSSNLYVQAATLNGVTLGRSWLRHSEIADGGVLELVMGPTSNGWAEDGPRPPSISSAL